MNKYLGIIISVSILFFTINVVHAKNDNNSSNKNNNQINNEGNKGNSSIKNDVIKNTPPSKYIDLNNSTDNNDNQNYGSNTLSNPLKNSIRKMEKLEEKLKNREESGEIGDLLDDQEASDNVLENEFEDMNARPGFLKFILGPNYKNAGQIRQEVVRLQNQIRQLTRLKTRLKVGDGLLVDDAITTLNSDLDNIKSILYENLSGFSLLGWLNRLLTGYEPLPTATPTPVESPLVSPTGTPKPVPTPTTALPTAQGASQ